MNRSGWTRASAAALLASVCAIAFAAQPANTSSKGAAMHCTTMTSKSKDGTMVACDNKHILFIVPGVDWTIDTSMPEPTLIHAAKGHLHVSVRLADTSETQYGLKEHLRAIYNGVAKLPNVGQVGEAHIEKTRNGHTILWYEVTGTAKGLPFRMVNAWTALRRPDRRYLDYHVSITAAPNDAAWQPAPDRPTHAQRAIGTADAFFVLDDNGKAPPQ
jgi:hypothetical protein